MSEGSGYHNRGIAISAKISNLLCSLGPATYDSVSPKIEFWIEYALTEQSMDADDLAERLSPLAWNTRSFKSNAAIARFLKGFRDAPHRSEQARSCLDGLCSRVLRWFAAAAAEDLISWNGHTAGKVASWGGQSFTNAASFVGHLIGGGMLDREHVRRHLIKPLIAHHYSDNDNVEHKSFRAAAIYQLLAAAGNAILQGLLEPEDVQVCFETLNSEIPFRRVVGLDVGKLQNFRETHTTWLEQREEDRRMDAARAQEPVGGDDDTAVADVPVEVETPTAFAPQDLPIPIVPPSFLHDTEYPSALRDVEPPSDAFTNDRTTAVSSPSLSISSISDLTPTESDDDIGEGDGERIVTRHEIFYLEDGNVEVVCGRVIFRVHSPIISFSSSKLRDILSTSTLLNAPAPDGCPRLVFKDSAEDFAVLLNMIYTPGFPARHRVPEFATFASLLRMAAKYGFSDVREALIEDLKGAYPTKWEDFESTRDLGEDVFESLKPHPNAVLNLFLEQNIKFALPFAAYRASLGGLPALVSDEPGTALRRPTLISIIHGMGAMNRLTMLTAYSVVHMRDLGVCPDGSCVLNTGIDSAEARRGVLKEIFNVMFRRSERDMLSPCCLRGNVRVCVNCASRLEKLHLSCRKELVWTALPSLLGWRSWEGV